MVVPKELRPGRGFQLASQPYWTFCTTRQASEFHLCFSCTVCLEILGQATIRCSASTSCFNTRLFVFLVPSHCSYLLTLFLFAMSTLFGISSMLFISFLFGGCCGNSQPSSAASTQNTQPTHPCYAPTVAMLQEAFPVGQFSIPFAAASTHFV